MKKMLKIFFRNGGEKEYQFDFFRVYDGFLLFKPFEKKLVKVVPLTGVSEFDVSLRWTS